MKNKFVKVPIITFLLGFWSVSCTTARPNSDNLPKDITDRTADEASQKYDAAQLEKMRAAIEVIAAKDKCSDAAEYTFAAIGAKACGGPVSYLPIPNNYEKELRIRIDQYNRKMSEYNTKYGMVSDCMMAAEPSGVQCKNDKAVLVY